MHSFKSEKSFIFHRNFFYIKPLDTSETMLLEKLRKVRWIGPSRQNLWDGNSLFKWQLKGLWFERLNGKQVMFLSLDYWSRVRRRLLKAIFGLLYIDIKWQLMDWGLNTAASWEGIQAKSGPQSIEVPGKQIEI